MSINLRPRGKGRKLAGRVKGGGRCGERAVWGTVRYEVESKSDDADGDDMARMSPGGDCPGDRAMAKLLEGSSSLWSFMWLAIPVANTLLQPEGLLAEASFHDKASLFSSIPHTPQMLWHGLMAEVHTGSCGHHTCLPSSTPPVPSPLGCSWRF